MTDKIWDGDVFSVSTITDKGAGDQMPGKTKPKKSAAAKKVAEAKKAPGTKSRRQWNEEQRKQRIADDKARARVREGMTLEQQLDASIEAQSRHLESVQLDSVYYQYNDDGTVTAVKEGR